jgi:hypothetical protein
MPSPTNTLFQFVEQNLRHLRSALASLDSESLARQSGFLQRLPRKIPLPKFLLALAGLAAETTLSLERVAAVIGLAAHTPYSKQALHQRLRPQFWASRWHNGSNGTYDTTPSTSSERTVKTFTKYSPLPAYV